MDNRMSPDESPISMTKNMRVKRANRWPIFISLLLVLVIGWITITVSQHRAEMQKLRERERPPVVTTERASEIIGDREAGWTPPLEKPVEIPPPPKPEPVPEPVKPPAPDIIGQHRDRIREQQLQLMAQAANSSLTPDGMSRTQSDRRQQMLSMIGETQKQINEAQTQISQGIMSPRSPGAVELSGGQLDQYQGKSEGNGFTNYARLSSDNNWDTGNRRVMPMTPYELKAGWSIPAVLDGGLVSDLEGPVVARVSRNVYDSATGNHLLIPAGTMLFGRYDSKTATGQNRLLVSINRIEFRDGSSYDIGGMPGVDSEGYSGFRDKVDNKYPQVFGQALMMSMIIAGTTMSQNNQNYREGGNRQRASDALSESLGQSLGTALSEIIRRNLSITPTITIRPGYEFNLTLIKDLIFDRPYTPHKFRVAAR